MAAGFDAERRRGAGIQAKRDVVTSARVRVEVNPDPPGPRTHVHAGEAARPNAERVENLAGDQQCPLLPSK